MPPPAPQGDNAAPLYLSLIKATKAKTDPRHFLKEWKEWKEGPSQSLKEAAALHLAYDEEILRISKEAASQPTCQFTPDYEQGFARSQPEFSLMNRAALNFCLQGLLAGNEGREKDSLKSLKTAAQIIEHLDSDLGAMALVSASTSRHSLVQSLLILAADSPKGSAYDKLLREAIVKNRERSISDFMRFDLLNCLLMLDQTESAKSRKEFGYGDMRAKPAYFLLSLFKSSQAGKREVLEGFLTLHQLAQQEAPPSDPRVGAAERLIAQGMMANPYSAEAFSQISDPSLYSFAHDLWSKSKTLRQAAILAENALVSGQIPPLPQGTDPKKLAVWRTGRGVEIGPPERQSLGKSGLFSVPHRTK